MQLTSKSIVMLTLFTLSTGANAATHTDSLICGPFQKGEISASTISGNGQQIDITSSVNNYATPEVKIVQIMSQGSIMHIEKVNYTESATVKGTFLGSTEKSKLKIELHMESNGDMVGTITQLDGATSTCK